MKSIRAIYENGVFRPMERVDLPDHAHVEVDVRRVEGDADPAAVDRIYAILSERYDSGESDVAARHDEHQP